MFRAFKKIFMTQCYINFRTTIKTVTKSLVIILFTLLDWLGRVILFLLVVNQFTLLGINTRTLTYVSLSQI